MARWDNKHDSDNLKGMEYRGVEYTIVQGIERGIWRWTVSLGEPKMIKLGEGDSKSAAVAAVECAIDKVLAPKKQRLMPPLGRNEST
jgi:hypothetical protein